MWSFTCPPGIQSVVVADTEGQYTCWVDHFSAFWVIFTVSWSLILSWVCTASNIITLPDYQCCDGDCRPNWLFTTMYFQRTQQGSTHSTQHSTTTKSCSMCQPSYRSPRTITNRSVKLCLIIYVLSYPAPHTSRSVKCPTHHTPHDHQQVSEVMSNNIIMSCPTLHPLPIDQWSVLPITLLTITNGSVSHQQVRRYVHLFCPALHISVTNRLLVSCFSDITPFGHKQVGRYVPLFCPIHHTSDKESPTGPWGYVQFALCYTC